MSYDNKTPRIQILQDNFRLDLIRVDFVLQPFAFAADQKEEVKPYPLDYCIVEGKPLGEHSDKFCL